MIPLGEATASRVSLVWRTRTAGDAIAWPRPAEGGFPTLATVHARPGIRVVGDAGPFAAVAGESLEVERLELMTRNLLDSLGQFDRSSPRDRASLLSGLVQAELQSRSATRMVHGNTLAARNGSRLLDRIQSANASRERTLREAGLESYLQTARDRVGLESAGGASKVPEPAEILADLRIRRLASPSYFQGVASERAGDPPLRWTSAGRSEPTTGPVQWGAVLAAFLVLPVAFVGLSWRRHPFRLMLVALAVSALVPMLGLAPTALVFAVGMFGLGCFWRGDA